MFKIVKELKKHIMKLINSKYTKFRFLYVIYSGFFLYFANRRSFNTIFLKLFSPNTKMIRIPANTKDC